MPHTRRAAPFVNPTKALLVSAVPRWPAPRVAMRRSTASWPRDANCATSRSRRWRSRARTRPEAASVNGADERRERGVDTRALLGVDHRAQGGDEACILNAAHDVLPAIG